MTSADIQIEGIIDTILFFTLLQQKHLGSQACEAIHRHGSVIHMMQGFYWYYFTEKLELVHAACGKGIMPIGQTCFSI